MNTQSSLACGECWINKSNIWRPQLNTYTTQHTCRGHVESMPQWVKSVLVARRPTHYLAAGFNVMTNQCVPMQTQTDNGGILGFAKNMT